MLKITILLLAIVSGAKARTDCMRVTGRLLCDRDTTAAHGAEIYLMDRDGAQVWCNDKRRTSMCDTRCAFAALPWERDDTMGRAWSDRDGRFTVSGCGSDTGPWNTIDPYLKIQHECR